MKGERSGRFPPESPRLNMERQRSAAGIKDSNIVMACDQRYSENYDDCDRQ